LISVALPAVVRIETGSAIGSAFFVKRDTLLTNVHVVAGNSSVGVRLPDGRSVQGRVDATAPEYDIAVVRVAESDGSGAVLPMGSALRTRAGQEIVALGSPLGLQNTVTRGIVSALRQVGPVMLVQTDAAINPGNSGGPLIDRSGRVIAIATMTVKADVGQGLSFGVAIEHAQALLDGHLASGSGSTPASGLNQMVAGTPQAPSAAPPDARDVGVKAFERAAAAAASDADVLDARWPRFVAACYQGPISGGFDRPWFALFAPRAMQGAVAPGCESTLTDLRESARRIRDAVLSADEAARRADVYPGTRRDVLRRYRLDALTGTP
jgi:S1-C subfamily serine protease